MTVLFMLTIFGIALARPNLKGTKEADAPMADKLGSTTITAAPRARRMWITPST